MKAYLIFVMFLFTKNSYGIVDPYFSQDGASRLCQAKILGQKPEKFNFGGQIYWIILEKGQLRFFDSRSLDINPELVGTLYEKTISTVPFKNLMIFDRASKSLSLYHQQAGRSRWRGIDDELPHLFQLFALRGEIESLEAYRWSLETSGQDYFLKTTDGSFYKPTMLGFASQLREIAQSPFGLVEDGHDPSDSHKLLYEMDGSYLHSFRFTSKIEASYPLLLATVSNEGNRAISKDTRLDGRKGIQLVNPVDGKSHFVVQEIPHGLQVISPEGIRRMLLDKSRKLMKPDSQRFSTVTAMASNDDRLIILMENTDRHYSLALVDTKMIFDDRAQSLAFLSSEVTVDPDRNFPAKNLFHVEAKGDFIHVHGWRKSSQNQKTFIEWVYQIEGANRQGLKLVDIKTTTIILNDSEQGLD